MYLQDDNNNTTTAAAAVDDVVNSYGASAAFARCESRKSLASNAAMMQWLEAQERTQRRLEVISDQRPSVHVDTPSTQGRLNQWAHWARAQGPRIFFLFEGPATGCGEINF